MATAGRDVDMRNVNYSSSPELSSLPSDSPSEPGSPSRLDEGRANIAQQGDEIIVDTAHSNGARFTLMQSQAALQQGQQQHAMSVEGVRLTKDGVPRKKPGRKPGSAAVKKATPDGTTDTTKAKRPRKPRDPNLPPIQRKRKVPPTTEGLDQPVSGQQQLLQAQPLQQRAFSGGGGGPKIAEFQTSMRMDIDPRPAPQALAPAPANQMQPQHMLQHLQQPQHHQQLLQQQQQQVQVLQQQLFTHEGPVKRENIPNSMQNILNADPPPRPQSQASPPARTVGQSYDPVRSSNYDPVRETMLSRDPYGTGPLGSPRAPSQIPNRASASPSIASLVDPTPPRIPSVAHPAATAAALRSPVVASSSQSFPSNPPAGQTSRYFDSGSLPPSPSRAAPTYPPAAPTPPPPTAPAAASKPPPKAAFTTAAKEVSRPPPPPPAPAVPATKPPEPVKASKAVKPTPATKPSPATKPAPAAKAPPAAKPSPRPSPRPSPPSGTSFKEVAMSGVAPAPSSTKQFTVLSPFERLGAGRKQVKTQSTASSPKMTGAKETTSAVPDLLGSGSERSILDFGRAKPGEEQAAPSIVLHIPLKGETNKYVNFMRLAEEQYGWDALHPRLAANRDRKARIAAATAALERAGSGRESGDEMSVDLQSGDEGSNVENANGAGPASGADGAPAKPVRKKRNFKEDEYDRDDDFVDDSELLWEEQAAASRDGFFVYSGPLVPEVEKPAPGSEGPSRRGRGGRGRGGAGRAGTGRGTGRGGGPGSRGGVVRKPRMTKVEKAQREHEKAERERVAQLASKSSASFNTMPGTNPPFSAGLVIDV